jgi:hypothetical protein
MSSWATDDWTRIFERIPDPEKNKKNFLCAPENYESLKSFWGEQQAVVTLVAAACNFYKGSRFAKNSGRGSG